MAAKKQPPPTTKISKHVQHNLLLAQDPLTSAAVLEKLSLSTNDAVRRAVTANPNTPGRVLLRLSKFCCNAFAHNPALPILMLDDPTFLTKIPMDAARQLVKLKDLSAPLLQALASSPHKEVRVCIAKHRALPEECMFSLLFDTYLVVRQSARKNINLPDEYAALLDALGIDKMGFATRECRDVSVEILHRIASMGLWGKSLVVRHPQTPPELLVSIFDTVESIYAARSPGQFRIGWQEELSQNLLIHPNTPLHVLERALLSDSTRWFASQNPRLPMVLLEPLLDKLYFSWHLLARQDLSERELALIIQKSMNNANPPEELWSHPSLAPKHLAQLSASYDASVRRQVALHPKTPSKTRQELTKDEDPEVRRAARSLA